MAPRTGRRWLGGARQVRSRPGREHDPGAAAHPPSVSIEVRWTWLKDRSRWTSKQITQFHHLSRMGLKTGRAWRLKERLREIFAETRGRQEADTLLTKWYVWARRCRLKPFKKLAWTLRKHWPGLLNGFDSRLSNGSVEGMNAMVQAAKARARGYHRTSRNLITMAYLIGAKLSRLPASPYNTTSGVAA